MKELNTIHPVTAQELIEMFEELIVNYGSNSIVINKTDANCCTIKFEMLFIELYKDNKYSFDYSSGDIYHEGVKLGRICLNKYVTIQKSIILKRMLALIGNEHFVDLFINEMDELVKLFLLRNKNLNYKNMAKLIDTIDLNIEGVYEIFFERVFVTFDNPNSMKILSKLQAHNAETKELLFDKIFPVTKVQMLREISEEANKQFQTIKSY